MMFAVCDPGLNRETHVTLILRWLCGLSPKEIGQAFLVDTQTIDRRLHRGRGRLRQLGGLPDVDDLPDIGARRDSVLRSLYLLFNEGYHGSNPHEPVRPFLCEDALRLTGLLLDAKATAHPDVAALAALFCFDSARLQARLDEHGVFVPLEDQDRSRWDRARIERGLMHLARSVLHALGGMLMGRGTYEYFADVMPKQTGPYADAINAIRKYVFSSTLENADWNNSTLIRANVVTAVTELKQEDGGDLMMYGYGRLSQTLVAHHLVDEIRFSIHPVLVGGGAAGGGNGKTLPLKLLGATPAPNGVVALTYQSAFS